jgi:hypothetical protein
MLDFAWIISWSESYDPKLGASRKRRGLRMMTHILRLPPGNVVTFTNLDEI